jgi:hypothetical protein
MATPIRPTEFGRPGRRHLPCRSAPVIKGSLANDHCRYLTTSGKHDDRRDRSLSRDIQQTSSEIPTQITNAVTSQQTRPVKKRHFTQHPADIFGNSDANPEEIKKTF